MSAPAASSPSTASPVTNQPFWSHGANGRIDQNVPWSGKVLGEQLRFVTNHGTTSDVVILCEGSANAANYAGSRFLIGALIKHVVAADKVKCLATNSDIDDDYVVVVSARFNVDGNGTPVWQWGQNDQPGFYQFPTGFGRRFECQVLAFVKDGDFGRHVASIKDARIKQLLQQQQSSGAAPAASAGPSTQQVIDYTLLATSVGTGVRRSQLASGYTVVQ